MLMRSIDESLAASRRTSCWRCSEAWRGRVDVAIVYRPPAAAVQRAAISAWPPSSGLMYQVSAGGPGGAELHPDTTARATTAIAVIDHRSRRRGWRIGGPSDLS